MDSQIAPKTLQLPPEMAEKYHPIGVIGEGANGVTWLANTITQEKVAIKVLHLAAAENWKSLSLFEREAEVLASLNVEGIPRFYESHFGSNGECILVQQYIPAPSLQAVAKEKGNFSEKDTLRILYKVAEILQVLHLSYAPPIIHRDIKPSNILYSLDAFTGEPHVWLIDFGAVANPQKSGGGSTIAGTSGYMAPEQLLGKCSIASDYYALGVTALQMLTGIEPYTISSTVFSLDYTKVLDEHAPNTSPYMRELLSILVSPKEEDRPKDAKVLCNMILNVQKGKSPCISMTEEKKKSWLSRYWERLFPKKRIYVDKTWIKVPGLIRYYNTNDYIEYTFYTKEGEFLCGAFKMDKLFQDFINKRSIEDKDKPIPCEIHYHPKRPIFNEIVRVIQDETPTQNQSPSPSQRKRFN